MEILMRDFPDWDELLQNFFYIVIREQVGRNPEVGINGLRENLGHSRVLADIGADEQIYSRTLKILSLGGWFCVLQPSHRFERGLFGSLVSVKKFSEQHEIFIARMPQRIRIGV